MEDNYKTTDKYNRYGEKGRVEELNPTPMQPPLGYVAQPSLAQQIREQIQAMRRLEDNEPESEEEADDFDIPDDPPDPESRWENDNIPSLAATRKYLIALEKELAAQEKGAAKPPPEPALVEAPADN